MNFLNFSYHSVGVFAALLIMVIMSSFLLFKKDKTPPTWWLFGVFTGYGFMLLGYFLAYSISTPFAAYHRYFTMIALFANFFYIGFTYYFPRLDQPKEAKIAIAISFILVLLAYLEFIFSTLKMEKIYNFTAHFYTFDYGEKTSYVILLTQLWPLSVLIRKTIRYSEYNGYFSKWLTKPNSILHYPKFIFSKFIVGWIKFIRPIGKDAHSSKSFSKSIMSLLVVAIANVLNKSGIISFDLYAVIYANFTLLICFYIMITYINNSPEPTSFMVKLVGVTIVTLLLVLGYVGNFTLSLSEDAYDSEKKVQILGSKQFILDRKYDQLPSEIEYIIVRPASADIFDKSFTSEFIREPNLLTSNSINLGIEKFKDFTIKETLTKVLKEKNKNIAKDKPTDEEIEEAISRFKNSRKYKNIAKDNSIELNRLYREAGNLYIHFDFVQENIKYEVGFNYMEYRKYTHKNISKLILIILFTVFTVLILFPKFFQVSLVKPLNNLLEGVTKVNDGDLEIEVPIKVQDEIGYLAKSFNSMVASIKQARKELQDYADNLEEKVKERTREVQEKMEEVQKLKVQQDGDYFLTSLLAKPLFFNANKSKRCVTEFIIHQKKKFEFRNKSADLGGDICITGNLRFGTQNKNKRYTMILNGDAMGKSMQGAGGSLVMGVVINSIMSRSASNKRILEMTPTQWLTDLYYEVNSVFKSFNGTMVISATVFLIDDSTGESFYFNAEHPYTILYRDGVATFIEDGLNLRKLGIDSEYEFKVFNFKLEDGDTLILASDGRDDIDLTPNEPVRTFNEDEFMILDLVKIAKGDIHQLESLISAKGNITDDLSFLKLEYFANIEDDSEVSNDEPQEITQETADIILEQEIEPVFNISNIYRESKSLYQKGEVNKALETLMSAYSIDPNNQKLNKLLGLISFKGKDYTTAVDVLNKYLKQDPDTEEMWYYLSLSQKKLGNYLESLEASKKVFELKPTNINNLVNLSDLYRLTGNFKDARDFSEKAIALEPNNQNARKILQFLGNT